ncbi:MAG: (2Fe-2S)-binding protein [Thermoleophilia bacterium]|jgi:bacterioferritin-associated ferredoxin|nr:(2Fe-2S)-binding protein [Thermoleophilia bacterium]
MTKTILCLCRDVSEEDVRRAVAEGYDDLETLKRFTGACTGPCQGKTCVESIRRLVAELTGRDLAEVPPPPRRPPAAPVRLGTLAATADTPAVGRSPAVGGSPAAGGET